MSLKKLLTYLVMPTIFMSGFSFYLGGMDFYLFYPILALFILINIFSFNLSINLGFFWVFIFLMLISFANAILNGFSYLLILKQIIGIPLSALAYYMLIKINDYDVEKLFNLYLKIAFFVSIIGIIQELSYLIGFQSGYQFSFFPNWTIPETSAGLLKIQSIFPEPSFLAIFLTPAMFAALNSLLSSRSIYINKNISLIILAVYLLTFSPLSIIGVFLASMLILYRNNFFNFRNKKLFLLIGIIPIIMSFVASSYWLSPEIKDRVDSTLYLFSGNKIDLRSLNLSVFAFYTNYLVTVRSFEKNPIFGSGIGTHSENYDRYIVGFLPVSTLVGIRGDPSVMRYTGLNKNDANSLFLRLVSETGLFGLIVVFYFLIKQFIPKRNAQLLINEGIIKLDKLAVINNGILVFIALRMIRLGHYFIDGLFFFVFLYYFSSKIYAEREKKLLAGQEDLVK